jgi:hypothetical protein
MEKSGFSKKARRDIPGILYAKNVADVARIFLGGHARV